jgi:hypothetical protein
MDGNGSSARVIKMKKSFIQICIFALLLSTFSLCATAQERFLKPVDEADKDASFKLFRDKLIDAVERRNAKYVLSILDPKIKNGFGGSDGVANFKKIWKINNPKSELWGKLLFVLTNGGAFTQEGGSKTFTAPYFYSNFPDDLDAFEYGAVFGKNIKLRRKAEYATSYVAILNHNIVKVDYQNSVKYPGDSRKYAWLKVETLDGKSGFIRGSFFYSPIDYRAAFEKKRGLWKMTFFLAGD